MNPRILWGMENPEDRPTVPEEWLCYMVRWFWQVEKRLEEKEGTIMDCRKEEALNRPLKIENTRKALSLRLEREVISACLTSP